MSEILLLDLSHFLRNALHIVTGIDFGQDILEKLDFFANVVTGEGKVDNLTIQDPEMERAVEKLLDYLERENLYELLSFSVFVKIKKDGMEISIPSDYWENILYQNGWEKNFEKWIFKKE